jgi:acyl carrier protein
MTDVPVPEAIEMLAEVSGISDIHPDSEFKALSLDSLTLIDWVSKLEETLDVEFNIRDLDISELGNLKISEVVEALRKLTVSA